MTNADKIRRMSDKELAEHLNYICDQYYAPDNGWLDWLQEDDGEDMIETNVYDQEERIYPCTVQILKNSETGEVSWGWWEGEDPPIIRKEKDND